MNRKIFVPVLTVLTGLYIYTSCTKIDTTDLGNDLIPTVDNVNTFDTVFDVVTDNLLLNDTTVMYGRQPVGIGVIANDPEFGKTEAAAYFSVSPGIFGTHPFSIRDSIKIDSVVLSLVYSSQYGDSNSVQDFEVYEIDPSATFADSNYRVEGPDFPVAPALLGNKVVDFKTLNDSVFYVNVTDSIQTVNELRIMLDTAFGRQFINFDTATEYKTDSAFRVYFKGLAVKINEATSTAKNGLAYFNLTGAATRLTFYCRETDAGDEDTVVKSFAFSGRLSNIIHRTPANSYLTYLNNGVGNNDDQVYIQSSPGSYVQVKIPGLENMSNRVIHRAELVLEQIPSAQEDIYTPQPLLFIDGINAAGDSVFTLRNDFQYTGSGIGYDLGVLRGDLRNRKYTFNISRYVQSIITKKLRSHTLRIYAPFVTDPYFETPAGDAVILPSLLFINSPIASGRVVVGGGSHPTQKMRVRIIYSKI